MAGANLARGITNAKRFKQRFQTGWRAPLPCFLSAAFGPARAGQQTGIRLVIADAARLDIAPNGKQLKRETLHERFGLPKPDRHWRWDLAPIPEWSEKFHRVHEVGAWIYGG